ncbi:MAG: signal peptidase II [Oscillospiraceae bacterium]|jgi:signal peptidase II|nr:signal peptidase II [Oscillospiraceae bacterium]
MPTMPKPTIWTRLLTLAAAAALITADQWIKRWMTVLLADEARVLVPGLAGLRYARNTGISFSLFGESEAVMRVISAVTALVMLAGVVWLLLGRIGGAAPLCGTALILAGGVGNLFDRLLHGFVVDYIELLFTRFAIFNFADICITCGVALVACWVLWSETRQRRRANANG